MVHAELGLNFSHRRAASLGLDAGEAFYAVLIHLRPRLLRLSLYWDELAPEPGRYDFGSVRWHLDRAQEYGCRSLLTVGFKPQRHPSFHPPDWLRPADSAGRNGPQGGRLAAHLVMMLERAVARLADYDIVDAWEIENAPYLPLGAQPPGWSLDDGLLRREADVVREVDPRHRPVVVSLPVSRRPPAGLRRALAIADTIGWECSPLSPGGGALASFVDQIRLDYLAGELRLLARVAQRSGARCWLTELGTASLPDLVNFAERSRVERAYFIGAEEWLLRRERGDDASWNLARSLLRASADDRG